MVNIKGTEETVVPNNNNNNNNNNEHTFLKTSHNIKRLLHGKHSYQCQYGGSLSSNKLDSYINPYHLLLASRGFREIWRFSKLSCSTFCHLQYKVIFADVMFILTTYFSDLAIQTLLSNGHPTRLAPYSYFGCPVTSIFVNLAQIFIL